MEYKSIINVEDCQNYDYKKISDKLYKELITAQNECSRKELEITNLKFNLKKIENENENFKKQILKNQEVLEKFKNYKKFKSEKEILEEMKNEILEKIMVKNNFFLNFSFFNNIIIIICKFSFLFF